MSDLYFAYGSNLTAARLTERVGETLSVGCAELPERRLTFDKPSVDGSGKANLTEDPSGHVWGFLYRLAPPQWQALDAFEPGYRRVRVDVVAERGQTLAAQTYVATVTASGLIAFDWYKSLIVDGAREHGLPDDYILTLDAVPSRSPG